MEFSRSDKYYIYFKLILMFVRVVVKTLNGSEIPGLKEIKKLSY